VNHKCVQFAIVVHVNGLDRQWFRGVHINLRYMPPSEATRLDFLPGLTLGFLGDNLGNRALRGTRGWNSLEPQAGPRTA
jgi:hypothetical protein